MTNPIRHPWIRVLAVVLMGIGGLQILAQVGVMSFTMWENGLKPGEALTLLLTVLPSLGLIWLGWVLWNGDESFGASLQPGTRRFVGNGLIAVGVLMAVLAGGCALLVGGGMLVGGVRSADMETVILDTLGMAVMVVMVSGPFVALGLGLWVLGRQLKRGSEMPAQSDTGRTGD